MSQLKIMKYNIILYKDVKDTPKENIKLKGSISPAQAAAKRLGVEATPSEKKSKLKGLTPIQLSTTLDSLKSVRTDINDSIKVICQNRIDPEFEETEKWKHTLNDINSRTKSLLSHINKSISKTVEKLKADRKSKVV